MHSFLVRRDARRLQLLIWISWELPKILSRPTAGLVPWYLYSPILFDSQEANANYLPHDYFCTRLVWAAPDYCYYISCQKPLVYDGDADLKLPRQSWLHHLLITIVTDLRGFQPMENGEGTVVPAARCPQLQVLCNWLLTAVRWWWTMENGEWSLEKHAVTSDRGSEA